MARPRQPPSEFLAQVLTRRGTPDDLPYTNEAVWIIRQHLLDAVQVCVNFNGHYTKPRLTPGRLVDPEATCCFFINI